MQLSPTCDVVARGFDGAEDLGGAAELQNREGSVLSLVMPINPRPTERGVLLITPSYFSVCLKK